MDKINILKHTVLKKKTISRKLKFENKLGQNPKPKKKIYEDIFPWRRLQQRYNIKINIFSGPAPS